MPLSRRDATTLKLALRLVADHYEILTREQWRVLSSQMPTPRTPVAKTVEAVNRVRINGEAILRVRLDTTMPKPTIVVEYIADLEKNPGGVNAVMAALLVRVHELIGKPASDEWLETTAHKAGGVEPGILKRLLRGIEIEPAPETIH